MDPITLGLFLLQAMRADEGPAVAKRLVAVLEVSRLVGFWEGRSGWLMMSCMIGDVMLECSSYHTRHWSHTL